MHDAYNLYQLLKLTVQIESIAAFGKHFDLKTKTPQCQSVLDDYLFVGTRIGHLLIYSVTKKVGGVKHDVQLLCYNKNFSKKPVQQLDVIPAYEVLVSLSGMFLVDSEV